MVAVLTVKGLRSSWDDVTDEEILNAQPIPEYTPSKFAYVMRQIGKPGFDMSQLEFDLYHIKMLAESMRSEGWKGDPLIVFTDGTVPDGNHRVRAAKLAGIEVPVASVISREDYYASQLREGATTCI